jgi:hypothetical protein
VENEQQSFSTMKILNTKYCINHGKNDKDMNQNRKVCIETLRKFAKCLQNNPKIEEQVLDKKIPYETEIRRTKVQGQPRQKISKTLSQQKSWAWWLTPVITAT